jgi:hypothetical protein
VHQHKEISFGGLKQIQIKEYKMNAIIRIIMIMAGFVIASWILVTLDSQRPHMLLEGALYIYGLVVLFNPINIRTNHFKEILKLWNYGLKRKE